MISPAIELEPESSDDCSDESDNDLLVDGKEGHLLLKYY